MTTFGWRAPGNELHLLNPDGAWAGRLVIPARSTLLDAGRDWVLLLQRGEFDEHRVTLYELTDTGDANWREGAEAASLQPVKGIS